MSNNYTQLYVHCVWSTWKRLPLITTDIQNIVYAAITKQCQDLGCTVIAINGVTDHVHLLTRFPTTLKISELVGKAKGSSSHLINHKIKPDSYFRWQSGYGVFTVSHRGVDNVTNYIKNQQIHHAKKNSNNLILDWEI